MNGRKLSFALSLYKLFRVYGGYIATYPGGFAVHTSTNKAILLPYRDINNERKRFSVMRTFHLKELNVTVETGAEYLLAVMIIQTFFRIFFFAIGGKDENVENNVWLTDGDVLRISGNFTVSFNLFIILKNLLSKLKEK